MDDNLGEILDAVAAREAGHQGEDWTIIVVTDHGHQPQMASVTASNHRMRQRHSSSPTARVSRTATINPEYEIVDITPTVVSLFGGTPTARFRRRPADVARRKRRRPGDLKQALKDAIAMNDYPDIITNVALGLRTIFATVPYYVYMFGNDTGAGLPSFLSCR